MGFLVGSSRRSSIWRIVLCLRLNGLVYMFNPGRALDLWQIRVSLEQSLATSCWLALDTSHFATIARVAWSIDRSMIVNWDAILRAQRNVLGADRSTNTCVDWKTVSLYRPALDGLRPSSLNDVDSRVRVCEPFVRKYSCDLDTTASVGYNCVCAWLEDLHARGGNCSCRTAKQSVHDENFTDRTKAIVWRIEDAKLLGQSD